MGFKLRKAIGLSVGTARSTRTGHTTRVIPVVHRVNDSIYIYIYT